MTRIGRPPGVLLNREAFEAIASAKRYLKKDIAADAAVSASYVGDLLAHRCGASDELADRLARTLGVRAEALFPELSGWERPPVKARQVGSR